jgi:hypothetical protein
LCPSACRSAAPHPASSCKKTGAARRPFIDRSQYYDFWITAATPAL